MNSKENTAVRQQQIIAAVLKIIASQGLTHLTTAAIAREVGLTEGAIFKHFATKEEILQAAVRSVGNNLSDTAAGVARSNLPPEKKIRSILNLHLSLLETYPGMPRIIFSDELYTGYPRLKENIKKLVNIYTSWIETIFNEGMDKGIFRREFDPKSLAYIFIGLIQGTLVPWRLNEGGLTLKEQADNIYRAIILLAGYQGDNPG